MIPLLMNSPSPVLWRTPPFARRPDQYGSNIDGRSSEEIPEPVLATSNNTSSWPADARTRIAPSGLLNLIAFPIRFDRTCRLRSRS
jgi:hypothetical protein